jgi:hypothetical protein
VGFGANHGHVGGLIVPLLVILESPKQVVYTNTKHASYALEISSGRIIFFPSFKLGNQRIPYTSETRQFSDTPTLP